MDKTDPKMAIVALSKQTGFNQDSVMLQIFFRTKQTVNRKNQDSVPPLKIYQESGLANILVNMNAVLLFLPKSC